MIQKQSNPTLPHQVHDELDDFLLNFGVICQNYWNIQLDQ